MQCTSTLRRRRCFAQPAPRRHATSRHPAAASCKARLPPVLLLSMLNDYRPLATSKQVSPRGTRAVAQRSALSPRTSPNAGSGDCQTPAGHSPGSDRRSAPLLGRAVAQSLRDLPPMTGRVLKDARTLTVLVRPQLLDHTRTTV